MKLTGSTIFIAGGGLGIGRGLVESLHKLGNQVTLSGRRQGHLEETPRTKPRARSIDLVEQATKMRAIVGPNEGDLVTQFNDAMAA